MDFKIEYEPSFDVIFRCPKCGSVSTKVKLYLGKLSLECIRCTHHWKETALDKRVVDGKPETVLTIKGL